MKLGNIVADFRTALATKIAIGGTTATLQNATDDDGVALPSGRYFFTLNGDNSQKEHISCDLSGTAITNIKSVSRQGVETTGTVREHRVGSSVVITNFAHIRYLNDMIKGDLDFDDVDLTNIKSIELTETPTSVETDKVANVDYVNSVAIAGGVDANSTDKGITKLSLDPVSATEPIAVGDNDPRVPSQDENDALAGTSGTPSSSNKFVTNDDTSATSSASKVVRANASGKIDDSWLNDSVFERLFLRKSFTAGENIDAGDAVSISNADNQILNEELGGLTYDMQVNYIYSIFNTSANATYITAIAVYEDSTGSAGNITASIRAVSSNQPTGSNIGGITKTLHFTGSSGERIFVFDTPVPVSPSTQYCIVLTGSSQPCINYDTETGYYYGYSSNSGVTWVPQSNQSFWLKTYESYDIIGNIYKSDASEDNYKVNNFIGFADEAITASSTGNINIIGIDDNQTGLTVGVPYYLSDTAGEIATSAGTVEKKVGLSVSATEILIKNDN